MLENLFGELGLDSTFRAVVQKLGRLSFSPTSQLRVTLEGASNPVTVSSGTITTVTTASMSLGDMGKPATAQLLSQSNFTAGIGRNFVRS